MRVLQFPVSEGLLKKAVRSDSLNMTENTRRTLRNSRRPQNYLNSQVSLHRHQDSDGDAIPNHRNFSANDTKHGGSQTKALAELLARFVNQTNAHYREMRKGQKDGLRNQNVKPQPSKPAAKSRPEKSGTDATRKKPIESKPAEEDSSKAGKSLYNFKAQYPTPEQTKPIGTSVQDKNRQIQAAIVNAQEKALNIGMSLQYYPYLNQGQINSLPNGITPQMIAANQELTAQLMMQRQAIYNQAIRAPQISINPYESEHRQAWKPNSELVSDSKLFKRSSFHVAIAYHIYLKNLKITGKELTDANDIDPTWPARKMREVTTKDISEEIPERIVQPEEPSKKQEKGCELVEEAQERQAIKEEEPIIIPFQEEVIEKKEENENEVSLLKDVPEKDNP